MDSLLRIPLVSLEVLDSVEDMDAGESVGAGAKWAGSKVTVDASVPTSHSNGSSTSSKLMKRDTLRQVEGIPLR